MDFSTHMSTSTYKLTGSNQKKYFNILIVDDDVEIATFFGEILQNRGHDVTIVSEGTSCIGKCQNHHYDILFIDFHMENLNGVDIVGLIKNTQLRQSIVFAFTGDDSIAAITRFKSIGMDGAIIKPLDINLINRLMTTLELRKDFDKHIVKSIKNYNFKKQLFVFN